MSRRDASSPSPFPTSSSTTRRGSSGLDRRRFLTAAAALGATSPLLVETLWAEAEGGPLTPAALTPEALAHAEQVAGLEFTSAERDLMLSGLEELRQSYAAVRAVDPDNSVPPALGFRPADLLPGGLAQQPALPPGALPEAVSPVPREPEDLAYATVAELSGWLRRGDLSSRQLTELYLARLEHWDPLLECVVTETADRALAAADRADREMESGRWRGPLHGVPWGAKDLLAVSGYPTTWGAEPYRDQQLDEDATVVRLLDDAGAVLVAKLTLGALAWGDVWFDGKTRNPWKPSQGSSGSSAGSASATAAGLVGFAIGSETWGSIVSPASRCGATGLRPTFGRVSRHGAMALAWSMDKLGPICRSVEDCALVFSAIHGADGLDSTALDSPFAWEPGLDARRLRVGYVKSLFDAAPELDEDASDEDRTAAAAQHANDRATLEALAALGIDLVPFELPADLPVRPLSYILTAEASAAFDSLTRSGRDDLLVRQIENAWPNVFRQGRMIPAVEYLQANRVRTLLLRRMEEALGELDAYLCPSFGGDNLLLTNLTGHPCVVLPNGYRPDGTPTSITFNGRLFREAELLALAKTYQDSTGWHRGRPDLEAGWTIKKAGEDAADG